MSATPKVFVVDDHAPMRRSVTAFLQAAGLEVEAYASAEAFLEAYTLGRPGCLILDLKMPRMSGLELQEHLTSHGYTLPVIVVSGTREVSDAVRAMKQGSFEYLEKPYQPEVLLQRVREALNFDRESREARAIREEAATRLASLSPREREILVMVVMGRSSKAIADLIGLSVSTVDNHRAHIMKKLKAETSADLTRIALLGDPGLASPQRTRE